MSYLKINHDKITPDIARALVQICPFGAISESGGSIDINAACKMCGMCVKKGPAGAVELIKEDTAPALDKSKWKGIAVYAEIDPATSHIHPVAFELLGKAKSLASVTSHPVYALLIGSELSEEAEKLLAYGADKVYLYDAPEFAGSKIDTYTNAFSDFVENVHPSSVMVGATNLGRSLAPRVAARFNTGLTADCTVLEMKENTDLVQIRPAFGGNIMAQIITPNTRPQFCTVRYKIFSACPSAEANGEIVRMSMDKAKMQSVITVNETKKKPIETDISEAEIIVACGRGVKNADELAVAADFAEKIGATLACTRPLVESGMFDPKKQIGLSGRTVKPKLIITLGVSGSVQFAAGMNNSARIIAINTDPAASIFKIAHIGLVGDWKEIIKRPLEVLS
ncbi:MAG: electron transfer flavoprotein subunit alpha [Eubacteriales bacterium]